MTDKIVSLDNFRVLKKQEEDQDDFNWKELVLQTLDEIKARVESGETTSMMITELADEIGEWRTHMLGLGEYDLFTLAGILEMQKLTVLDTLYDE